MKAFALALLLAFSLPFLACDDGQNADDSGQNGSSGKRGGLRVGDSYPDLEVLDCDGQTVSLREYISGYDVTYLTFGAQWCVACQEEAPIINQALVDGLADKNVGVVQILVEDNATRAPSLPLCGAWKKDLKARFDVLVDTEQVHLDPVFQGAIATLPLHLVLTQDQVVRYQKLGDLPRDIQDIVKGWLP